MLPYAQAGRQFLVSNPASSIILMKNTFQIRRRNHQILNRRHPVPRQPAHQRINRPAPAISRRTALPRTSRSHFTLTNNLQPRRQTHRRQTIRRRPRRPAPPYLNFTRRPCAQFIQRRVGHKFPLPQDRHPIAKLLHRAQRMTREKNRPPPRRQPAQMIHQPINNNRVQPIGWFIQNQQPRLMRHRQNKSQLLLRPARHRPRANLQIKIELLRQPPRMRQ